LPDMERLWTAWWSVDTVGRAIAVLQYVSCLMYPVNEKRCSLRGLLTAEVVLHACGNSKGICTRIRWLEPNVAFLNRVLGVRGVSKITNRAVDRLVGQLEHDVAVQIQTDLPLLTAAPQARCAELPQLLESTREPGRTHAWST